MNENPQFWNKLIDYWCIEEEHNGLTIPNIIGAVKLNTEKIDFNIEMFFDEISQSKEVLKIRFCGDLDEFVIGRFKKTDAPKHYYENQNTLYYNKRDFETEISSYDDLKNYFNNLYRDKIKNELYSKDYYTKEWVKITDEDIQLHNNVIEN